MTNEELQAHIAALRKAHADGIVEESVDGEWREFDGEWILQPVNDLTYEYRIKPQPREVWIAACAFERQRVVTDAYLKKQTASGMIKFREVLDD